jgi:hypothetical protein
MLFGGCCLGESRWQTSENAIQDSNKSAPVVSGLTELHLLPPAEISNSQIFILPYEIGSDKVDKPKGVTVSRTEA